MEILQTILNHIFGKFSEKVEFSEKKLRKLKIEGAFILHQSIQIMPFHKNFEDI